MSVAEMRMLRWICGHRRMDRVRNDDICDRLEVAPIEEKLVQHRLSGLAMSKGDLQRHQCIVES